MPGQFYRSKDGLSGFVPGPKTFPPQMRHSAVQVMGPKLVVFYSRIGDQPESILLSSVDLTQPYENWMPSQAVCVLKPQTDWEGVDFPIQPSQRGPVIIPVHQLRDPAFFVEDGRYFIVYSVAGEWGLAISEFWMKPKKA